MWGRPHTFAPNGRENRVDEPPSRRLIAAVFKFTGKQAAIAGLIAALYAVLSLVFHPISFGVYQIRIAEALTVIPFLTGAAIPGLFIGCYIANALGGMGWLDIVIGPLITLVAAFLTWGMRRLPSQILSGVIAVIPVFGMWAGGVYMLSGWLIDTYTAIGLILSAVALLGAFILEEAPRRKKEGFRLGLWIWRVVALLVAASAVRLLRTTPDSHMYLAGGLLLLASVAAAMILARIRQAGENVNAVLAPLPPVLLNAFGVSLYLAPVMGVDYWFAVQMIGVGQLIACYLLGLPLLMMLRRRGLFV